MIHFIILSFALLLDRLIGDPDWLWRRFKHPVAVFGAAIAWMDKQFNGKRLTARQKRSNGIMVILALLVASVLAGFMISRLLDLLGIFGIVVEIVIVAIFLAQKSLSDHVLAVAAGLRDGGLEGGRRAVSMVVGRDPKTLDESGICRAAIETLAENFSDGVVAPALFYAVFGLPGLFAYKMLNTADSMIGHTSPRYLDFGWASARLDDLFNWPAARLSMLLIAAGAAIARSRKAGLDALRLGLSDHGLHRSPNSGWPEAAMAGALGVALAGPRVYGGQMVSEPMLNGAGRTDASAMDIELAIRIFEASCTLFNVLVPTVALIALL
jgi:adenosylcobinamide-phosphate synthase